MDFAPRIGIIAAVAILLAGCDPGFSFAPEMPSDEIESSDPTHLGLWVFTDEISDADAAGALLDYASRESFTRLYVSVYSSRENAQGQLLYEHHSLRRFISAAHERGIEIWAAYGNPDWPELGCGSDSFPCLRLREVVAYNEANPSASFDGVMLDVEPEEGTSLLPTLDLYADILNLLTPHRLPVATAISAFWSSDLARSGSAKPAFQHVLDQRFHHVLVMCYRNFAEGANGAIELCADEMRYADQLEFDPRLVVGLRTTPLEIDGGWSHESFAGIDHRDIQQTIGSITEYFDDFESFDGVAYHRYERLTL